MTAGRVVHGRIEPLPRVVRVRARGEQLAHEVPVRVRAVRRPQQALVELLRGVARDGGDRLRAHDAGRQVRAGYHRQRRRQAGRDRCGTDASTHSHRHPPRSQSAPWPVFRDLDHKRDSRRFAQPAVTSAAAARGNDTNRHPVNEIRNHTVLLRPPHHWSRALTR